MSRILKHKKILILIILVAVFTTLFINRNRLSFLTSVSKDKYEYNLVEDGEERIKIDNENYAEGVTFDVYFLKDVDSDGNADGVRNTELMYGKSDKIYFDLNVSGDYSLKNGKIRFTNNNVKVSGTLAKSSVIPKTLSSTNYTGIDLSEVAPGTSSFFYLNVSPYIDTDLKKFSDRNEVEFTGTIVNIHTGEEIPVTKKIYYDVDSYSKNITTSIGATTSSNPVNVATITYSIEVLETANAMPLKASYLTGSVSDFEGRHPTSVTVRSADGASIDYTYDSESQTFTAVKNAEVNDDKVITRQAYTAVNNGTRYNKWYITVQYPIEEGEVLDNKTANISLEAWNVGFTNSDLEEKKSNVVQKILSHTFTILPYGNPTFTDKSKIEIGSYLNSLGTYYVKKDFLTDVYLGQESGNYIFNEKWKLDSKTDRKSQLYYTETGNKFSGSSPLKDYTTYKTMAVSKVPNIPNYKIYIYNGDNNELLHVITSENVNEVFNFPENVRLINILTSTVEENKNFTMNLSFTKEINTVDMMNRVTLQNFLSFGTISNSGYVYEQVNNTNITLGLPYNGNASFSDSYSSATLSSEKTSYTREVSETSIPMVLKINHNTLDAAHNLWNEGFYLLKLPKEIIGVENLSVYPSPFVVSSEVIEMDNQKFIKIISNNPNSYNIDFTVVFNAIINPKTTECSGYIDLYAINNISTLYYNSINDTYDINGNGSRTDKASYSRLGINIAAPKELLTGSIITDYDDLGSQTVSPLIADIDPKRGQSDANVNVFLINNSTFKIKDIDIVGKVAYEGNTYEGITGNLGSEFDTTMTGPIQIPEVLNGKATVYYSTKETPTKDLDDENNGWTQEVSDYSTIKTYMIKLDDSVEMSVNDKYDFYYPVDIPNSTDNLLKKSYYNHGVYFKRVTDAGLKDASVTAPKLGIRIARKYNLDIDLYKSYSNNKVPGGQYILTDEDGNSKTIAIDSNGHALVEDLYVNKEYTLKQYSSYYRYIKDDEEKTFKVTNGENDELVLTKTGTYRSIQYENKVLNVDLENEIYYTLDLHNIDADTNVNIKNTMFKVTGKNHENGSYIYTDNNGHAYLSGMELNQVYKVDQMKIDNYAPIISFNLKLERDPNTHEIKILVESIPTYTAETCDSEYTVSSSSISTDRNSTNTGTFICYAEVDLTNYREKYKITGSATLSDIFYSGYGYYSTFDVSVTQDEKRANATNLVHLYHNNSTARYSQSRYGTLDTTKAYKLVNGSNRQVDIVGGHKYYIFTRYYKTYQPNTSASLNYITIKTLDNKAEFIFVNEKEGVHPKEATDATKVNSNVTQKVLNYSLDATDNPVLEVEVKNKYIEKAYIEINKIDGETEESLSGAQFKVTGPGLPESGKYVKVNSEGKATVEVYLSYTGNTGTIPGMNAKYPRENFYTVEEIVPPTGYSKDDNLYTFKLVRDIKTTYNSEFDPSEYKIEYDTYNSVGNNNANTRFYKVDVDAVNKTWKVKVKDYPIVKVTKVDAETGVVLPNTYYAVYAVERKNGNETIDFAKDVDGNYIGEKVIINNKEYYIVKTDENGSFTLNLSGGQYQLKEIQASDKKYEIDDQIIYFGIGENVPYQAAGMTLAKATGLNYDKVNEKSYKMYPTDDGGFIVTSISSGGPGPILVMKLDKDGNEVWSNTLRTGYNIIYTYEYFDDPGRVAISSTSENYWANAYHVSYKEYDDGYYFASERINMFKLDKTTGEVLFHSTKEKPNVYVYTYEEYCDIPEGLSPTYYSEYSRSRFYDDKYYCNNSSNHEVRYNYFDTYGTNQHTDFGNDGYLYAVHKMTTNGTYGFRLKDGTSIIPEKRYGNSYTNDNVLLNDEFLLKIDKEGDVISARPIGDIIYNAMREYIDTNFPDFDEVWNRWKAEKNYYELSDYKFVKEEISGSYLNNFKVLDNGDYIFVGDIPVYEYQYRVSEQYSTTDNTVKMPFAIRLDKDLNVKYFIFLGYNGNIVNLNYSASYESPNLIINNDGTLEYFTTSSSELGKDLPQSNDVKFYLSSSEYNIFTLPKEEGHPNGFSTYPIYRWDINGMPETPIELIRPSRFPELEDTTNDMNRVYSYYYYLNVAKHEDGYIVGLSITSQGSTYSNSEPYRTIKLRSGEVVRIDEKTQFILYKVNADSSIEWVKQYGNIFSDRYTINRFDMYNNKFYTIKLNSGTSYAANKNGATNGEIITSINDPEYHDLNDNSYAMFLEFDLKDEIKASAPEAYNLTLENNRKQYKVTVTSNEGGSFDVKDENNSIIYTGTTPGTIETIKHGDDSKNKLIIKPDTNYGVKSVTVNGEKASYTVNDDGTLVVNKFTNVQEDKNIDVRFELGSSRVLVHHYLKGTTTKIADDELLQGKINDDYETEAKADNLYSLVTDSNGEYIVPSNYKGKFTANPIEVIYYYDFNEVELIVNFFKLDTTEPLAPTIHEQYLTGYRYAVEAANIPNYRVVNVLGDESGILNREVTEVTYYYDIGEEPQVLQGTVTVHHIATDTCRDLVPPITRTLDYGTAYETEVLSDIPEGYRYKSRTDNYFGVVDAEHNSIDVYYYYDRIKSRITVKYIDSDTKKEIEDRMNIYVNLGSRYVTKELVQVPKGYKLSYKPVNATGIANEERIEVVYKYIKDSSNPSGDTDNPDDSDDSEKDVKGASERNPNTGDFIGEYFIIGIISIVGIIGALLIIKKRKK